MINEFSPMVLPVNDDEPLDENCLQEGTSLMSRTSLVRGLSDEKKLRLLESVGLKSSRSIFSSNPISFSCLDET